MENLVKLFNEVDTQEIPKFLVEKFENYMDDVDNVIEIRDSKLFGEFVEVLVVWDDGGENDYIDESYFEDWITVNASEFKLWCTELGIRKNHLTIIKNEPTLNEDRFDRKRTNPRRNNLKLVA